MATIVEALEKLGILDPSGKNCYTVDKIVKSLQTESEKTFGVGIYLNIKEYNTDDSSNEKDTSIVDVKDSLAKQSSSNSSAERSSNSSDSTVSSSDSYSGSMAEEGCENISGTAIKLNGVSSKTNKISSKLSSAGSRTGDDAPEFSTTMQPQERESKITNFRNPRSVHNLGL